MLCFLCVSLCGQKQLKHKHWPIHHRKDTAQSPRGSQSAGEWVRVVGLLMRIASHATQCCRCFTSDAFHDPQPARGCSKVPGYTYIIIIIYHPLNWGPVSQPIRPMSRQTRRSSAAAVSRSDTDRGGCGSQAPSLLSIHINLHITRRLVFGRRTTTTTSASTRSIVWLLKRRVVVIGGRVKVVAWSRAINGILCSRQLIWSPTTDSTSTAHVSRQYWSTCFRCGQHFPWVQNTATGKIGTTI